MRLMKEEIDVVDAHDNVVGSADRQEAHRNGLLHRVVHVMVFNPDGKLFMQRRSGSRDLFPGFWEGSLSGHVHRGETPHNAAVRELREELGIITTMKHASPVLAFGFHHGNEKVLCHLFIMRDCKDKVVLDKDEVEAGEFWELERVEKEISREDMHPLFARAFADFRKMRESSKDFV